MAVTITDRRTVYDEADSTTGWTGGGFGLTTTDIAELTGAVAESLAITTGQVYFTGAALDLSDTLVYVYSFNNALQDSWTTGPNALLLGDGTDQIAFHMAGSDRRVFSHSDGPTSWQSFVLDGSQAAVMNTAGETTVVAGSFATLTLTAITDVGCHFITGSKALGGGYNVAVDILRYGNDGLRITGGGIGTEGTFLEIAVADRSTASLAAHGILRELTTGVYGIQGPITFGDSGAATNSTFSDDGIVLAFENRNISDDKYYLRVEGNTGSTNSFTLTNSTVTTAGPAVTCNFGHAGVGSPLSATFIDTLTLTAVSFVDLKGTITFSISPDAPGSPFAHNVTSCTFTGCGQINPGNVVFSTNTISGYTPVGSPGGLGSPPTVENLGAVVLGASGVDTGTDNWNNLTFESSGIGHGIYIAASGSPQTASYLLDTFTYTGYAAVDGDTGNEALLNNSGGPITLTISGGEVPTVKNGPGSSTTIVTDPVTTTITVLDAITSAPVQDARVYLHDNIGSPITTYIFGASGTLTNASGQVTDIRSLVSSLPVTGRVRRATQTLGSPLLETRYKSGVISGTIDNATGFTTTINLIPDE